MKREEIVIIWLDGLTSPSAKKISNKVRKGIEQELGIEIIKIEYAQFSDRNLERLTEARGIKEYAEVAFRILSDILDKYSITIFIGCSMGGLIARYLVEVMGLRVSGVILLAVPNRGIELSRIEKIFLKIKRPIPCVEDMRPGSVFLKSLKDSSFENYYFFGGTEDSRVNINSSLPLKGSKSFPINAGHAEMVDNQTIMKLVNIIKILMQASNQSLQI